jgi:hypothetical protein
MPGPWMRSFQKVREASALLTHPCHLVSLESQLLVPLLQTPMCIGVGFGKPRGGWPKGSQGVQGHEKDMTFILESLGMEWCVAECYLTI